MFEIVIVEGRGEGRRWPVTPEGLLVGRSPACQIHVPDVLLSRRHCELRAEDGHVAMRDLGSRNAVLINGVARREAHLTAGDRITCARVTLEVRHLADELETESAARGDFPEPSQSTLRLGDAIFVRDAIDVDRLAEDADAPAMIANLFSLTRRLARQTSVSAVVEEMLGHLRVQLKPSGLWFTTNLGPEHETSVHPLCCGQEVSPPEDLIRQAQREGVGVLAARRVKVSGIRRIESVLAVPVVLAGEVLGALSMCVQTPAGAYDEMDLQYLFAVAELFGPIFHAVEHGEQLQRDNAHLSLRSIGDSPLLGSSEVMQSVRRQIVKHSQGRHHVLILGETGTGKELAARLLHDQSPRARGPFVALNCAAIPNELFESELFGYVRGAFTGALQNRTGLFQQAHGGTLFLDEVAELSPDNQARLLRVVESGFFRRLGDSAELHADVRVVAATNRDIHAGVGMGGLRQDLYHRLGGAEVHLPPLRERREDIPELVCALSARLRDDAKLPYKEFSQTSMDLLMQHHWPGNVRELRNVIERSYVFVPGRVIEPDDIIMKSSAPPVELRPLETVEREHIAHVLAHCAGNTAEAARLLGIARSTLYNKIHEYRLS